MAKDGFGIREVLWKDVSNKVHKLNPRLAEICNNVKNAKDLSLYLIKYPYGAKIVNKGTFQVPIRNKIVPLSNSQVPLNIRNKLNYCSTPLALSMHNNSEMFIKLKNRVISLNYFKPGNLIGLFENINSLANIKLNSTWDITSGARSVLLTPKITDTISHSKIKKEFNINNEVPMDFIDQWDIFRQINLHSENSWYNEILVFSEDWFNSELINQWLELQKYLFEINLQQTRKDKIEARVLWAHFFEALTNKCFKPRPYIVDTIKLIFSIGEGNAVAFKPTIDESSLPASIIQQAYIDIYSLKHYIPNIIEPCKLNNIEQKVYYSLSFPTTLETSPNVRNQPSIIEDQREVKNLLLLINKVIKQKHINFDSLRNAYSFFHTEIDKYKEINNSRYILENDNRFTSGINSNFSDREFCSTSHFFRGFIGIGVNHEGQV